MRCGSSPVLAHSIIRPRSSELRAMYAGKDDAALELELLGREQAAGAAGMAGEEHRLARARPFGAPAQVVGRAAGLPFS